MVTIQKMSKLFGKRLSDRTGNEYTLVNIIPDPQTGHVKGLVFKNDLGATSRRLKDGRVYVDRTSPRDIVLTGLRARSRGRRIDFDYDDEDEDVGLDFLDIEDEPTIRKRRARLGSLGTPVIDGILDDEEDYLAGPNSKKSDNIEIHVHIHKR